MSRSALFTLLPMLLLLSIALSSAMLLITVRTLYIADMSTRINIITYPKIWYINENGTQSEVRIYKFTISIQSPSPIPYGGRFVQPLYLRIKPNESITVSTSLFLNEWKMFIDKIVNNLRNRKSTLVPVLYIEIIGIGIDGRHYITRRTITNYDVWFVMRETRGLDVSYSEFVLNNPIAVLNSGITFRVNISEMTFVKSQGFIAKSSVNSENSYNTAKTVPGNETTNSCTLYTPYSDALSCYLVGDQGIISGSSFAVDSPWHRLYQQRYSPPASWYNHIAVPPDLDKDDVVRSSWYQFAVGFSSVYYVKVSAFGDRSQALAALENLASAYIPAEGVHTLGDDQYHAGFISLLYSINKNSYHYWGILWANSKMGSIEVVTEPLGILYLNKSSDVPYQPSVTFSVMWAKLSTHINIIGYADVVSIITSSTTITEKTSKSLAIGYTPDDFNYAVIVWDVEKEYGPDVAFVYHDIIIAYDGVGNEYLVLIPHVTFDVIEYKTPYTETIRYYKNEMLDEYILPYNRGYQFEQLANGELSEDTEVSAELLFLITDNYKKYELIARPENVVEDVISWIIGSADDMGYASLVLMFMKYLSFTQTSASSELNEMIVTIVVHDLAGLIPGAVVSIYHKLPPIMSSGEFAVGGVYQIYTIYPSDIPCDPTTGNCIYNVN